MEAQTVKDKIACPYCDATFTSNMLLEMHLPKFHRDKAAPTSKPFTPTPLIPTQPQRPVKPQTTQQEELLREYNLFDSLKKLGPLAPMLRDKYGNMIDGNHRYDIDPNWPCITLEWVDTPEKLELARLAVNFVRRTMTPIELTERIGNLVKAGLKPDEISNITGIKKTTIYKYMPQGLKNKAKVEIGKTGGIASGVTRKLGSSNEPKEAPRITEKDEGFAESVQQRVNTSDTVKAEALPASLPTSEPEPTHSSFAKEETNFGASHATDNPNINSPSPQFQASRTAQELADKNEIQYRTYQNQEAEKEWAQTSKTEPDPPEENTQKPQTHQGTLTKYTYEGYALTEENQVLAYVNDILKSFEDKQVKITIEET